MDLTALLAKSRAGRAAESRPPQGTLGLSAAAEPAPVAPRLLLEDNPQRDKTAPSQLADLVGGYPSWLGAPVPPGPGIGFESLGSGR
jgi:hypothetical protein